MPVYKGVFGPDFTESKVTGLDRDAYNPGPRPNKYVANRQGTASQDLSGYLDQRIEQDTSLRNTRIPGRPGPVSD
jgi:hypothetical protein